MVRTLAPQLRLCLDCGGTMVPCLIGHAVGETRDQPTRAIYSFSCDNCNRVAMK